MPSEKQLQYLADMFSNIGLVFFGSTVAPAEVTSSPNWDLDKMRYLLVKIRTYFDEHPDEE